MNLFKPGDKVRLIMGGPVMTVRFYEGHKEVYCEWNNEDNEPQLSWFAESVLQKVTMQPYSMHNPIPHNHIQG